MAETLLGPTAVVARIMISGRHIEAIAIQRDAARLDIFDQQIEYRDGFEFFQSFGKPFLQTIPGRQIGVPSFRPQQGIDLQPPHILNDTAGHDFHGFVIPREVPPTGAFPIVRSHSPAFTGCMKDLPPVLQIIGVCVD